MNIKTSRFPLFSLIIFFISFCALFSKEFNEYELYNLRDKDIIIRMMNGDILTAKILDFEKSDSGNYSISVQTPIGKTKVFSYEIAEVQPVEKYNRQSHRIYLLPTAEPIGQNHFIGDFEMLFLYGGVGISNFLSITAGTSIIPYIPLNDQISVANAKVTFLTLKGDTYLDKMSFALGGNYALINTENKLYHIYTSISITMPKTIASLSVFTKFGNHDVYAVHFDNNLFDMTYENGSFGIAAGLDTRFSTTKDIHFIGEVWNSDVAKPTNTAVLVGFRICNTTLSADFGVAITTSPFFIPFASFVWTPF
ncbi:MAG TPA: hypothetical protein PLC04_03940 [Candidatus Kapabacteria bacterium]|nr:hypothetical protein [Candidatus Kapabacteria bacterium]HOV92214.1 hypothetical protein [Candidatus Kapabacteria bacterium]